MAMLAAAVTMLGCAAVPAEVPERELTFSVPAGLEGVADESMAEWNATCGYHFRASSTGFRITWAHDVGGVDTLGYTNLVGQTIDLDEDKLVGWSHDALVEIVSHEMGHAQGWLHSEDVHDIMYREILPSGTRRHVASSDCFY